MDSRKGLQEPQPMTSPTADLKDLQTWSTAQESPQRLLDTHIRIPFVAAIICTSDLIIVCMPADLTHHRSKVTVTFLLIRNRGRPFVARCPFKRYTMIRKLH